MSFKKTKIYRIVIINIPELSSNSLTHPPFFPLPPNGAMLSVYCNVMAHVCTVQCWLTVDLNLNILCRAPCYKGDLKKSNVWVFWVFYFPCLKHREIQPLKP